MTAGCCDVGCCCCGCCCCFCQGRCGGARVAPGARGCRAELSMRRRASSPTTIGGSHFVRVTALSESVTEVAVEIETEAGVDSVSVCAGGAAVSGAAASVTLASRRRGTAARAGSPCRGDPSHPPMLPPLPDESSWRGTYVPAARERCRCGLLRDKQWLLRLLLLHSVRNCGELRQALQVRRLRCSLRSKRGKRWPETAWLMDCANTKLGPYSEIKSDFCCCANNSAYG